MPRVRRTSLLAPDDYDRVVTPGPTPVLDVRSPAAAEPGMPRQPVVPRTAAHGRASDVAPAAPERIVYTCPMHPEVEGSKTDTCPKCGMSLVPRGKRK